MKFQSPKGKLFYFLYIQFLISILTFLSYEEYAKPVQFTYDNIVSNNLETLRGFTLDERAARIRDQYKQKEVWVNYF